MVDWKVGRSDVMHNRSASDFAWRQPENGLFGVFRKGQINKFEEAEEGGDKGDKKEEKRKKWKHKETSGWFKKKKKSSLLMIDLFFFNQLIRFRSDICREEKY